ncbi:MAG: lipid-A-disaccharide synthase [Bacteroidetes bacterium GWF2_38_335]|nr:MAG: lipid-A-disaccharide synthase [Bacteroidetes bacterium GWF2_38_335]OFY81062.1 MAG: lipid-A-disaccharide synthase [Bacteroidetes bacterium RIFOXYA12_FULL_38_20]HBS87621.1 lipid-A-disaccharide synthase [Bacteroidales bacterium]
MKYYVIAGEASGDLHGSNLMKNLRKKDPDSQFRCWGGDLMQEQGGEIVKHYRDLAFMGFIPVLLNIRTIFKNISFCKKDLLEYKPDVLILVDYPGFNLRIAEFAAKNNIKVFYYISPTVWAWHKSRIHKIRKYVTKLFVILPFEKDFYKKHDMDVVFEGHPLLDAIEPELKKKLDFNNFIAENNLEDKPMIALLAGSRKQEVKKMLPVMASLQEFYPGYQFVVAGVSALGKDFYDKILKDSPIKVLFAKTYEILRLSQAGLITSGTATLETALFDLPQAVCYKTGGLTFFIAKNLVDIKYISLVNLIMDKEVVTELIQDKMNKISVKTELDKLLFDENHRNTMLSEYKKLKEMLGGEGASERIAAKMHEILINNKTHGLKV